ncbi:MAG: flagellar motor switch phosphatase FliY, partial [Lachnospiraceae bacterium]|nr:flagellar motor switch phosphatase FliY [Lachnospiraceae bacterium]
MDGMLSQDEINALLNDMSSGSSEPVTDDTPVSDASPSGGGAAADQSLLTDIEKDAIGEVANISMGSSATTLYSLVNRKVNITTPVVSLATWGEIVEDYEKPCVFIKIKYTVGLEGTNILILREEDVKIITDLMMGGDGTSTDGELSELHLSAICEAMNQMMGSSATSLSSMLGRMIDISPPEADLVDMLENFNAGEDISSFLGGTFVRITFRMQIGDLVDSKIMQLYPIDFAKSLYDFFMDSQ